MSIFFLGNDMSAKTVKEIMGDRPLFKTFKNWTDLFFNHLSDIYHSKNRSVPIFSLTEAQTLKTQELFNAMKAEAMALGKQLVEKEQELDRQFASGLIEPATLNALMTDIGTIQARIRYVHLNAHLDQRSLLTKHQVQLYDRLRGYGTSHSGGHNHSH